MTWIKRSDCVEAMKELEALRAERDRLREELEEERGVRDLVMSAAERAETAWRAEHPEHGKFVIPDLTQHMVWCMNRVVEIAPPGSSPHRLWSTLAAENAGLRWALGAQAGDIYDLPTLLSIAAHCLKGGDGYDREGVVDDLNDRLQRIVHVFGERAPLTRAVQRVLEAVGESKRLADALEDLGHPDDEDEYEEVAAAYEAAMKELDAAHDHLQALLEGKGEGT